MKDKKPQIESPFLTIDEAAALFKVSETSVRRSRGDFAKLRRTVVNKRTLIYRQSAEDLIEELGRRAYAPATGGLVKHRNVE